MSDPHRTTPTPATIRHLFLPFAHVAAAPEQTIQQLPLPHLQALLARLTAQPIQRGAADSFSPPHEQALWQTLYPACRDQNSSRAGIPFATWLARQAGLELGDTGWGVLSLCHWQIGMDSVHMATPAALADMQPDEAQALFAAMQPWLEQDGLRLHPLPAAASWLYPQPHLHRLVQGAVLAQMDCASLLRVAGQSVQHWLARPRPAAVQTADSRPADTPGARWTTPVQRLQNELQMLLHTHPVNDARLARSALPVNALWFSATGPARLSEPQPATASAPTSTATSNSTSASPSSQSPIADTHTDTTGLLVCHHLADAALAQDWHAWRQAWQRLDATLIAQANSQDTPPTITLCGPSSWQSWMHTPPQQPDGWWQRLMQRLRPAPPAVIDTTAVLAELT